MTQKEKAYFVDRLERIAQQKISALEKPNVLTLEDKIAGINAITFTKDEILEAIRARYIYLTTAVERKLPKAKGIEAAEKAYQKAKDKINAEKSRVQDMIMLGGDEDALTALRNFENF